MITILDEINREELKRLCEKHGFFFDKIGTFIRIHSKRDTWYIVDRDYEGRLIELEHQNSYHDSRFHSQGKHKNLENVFKSIKSHDLRDMPGHRNNKLTRLTNIFKLLEVNN